MTDFTNLKVALEWLAGVGGPFVVGVMMSWLIENWKGWHTLPRWVKVVAPMLASVVIAVAATLIGQQEQFISETSPYFRLVMQAILTYVGTQKGYIEAKKADYGRTARLG